MPAEPTPSTFAAAVPMVTAGLARGAAMQVTLPAGGRLQIDRPVPFLCVYRTPADRADVGTAEFVTAESAFLIAPAGDAHHDDVARLAERIGDTLYTRFGGFLFVEVWSRNFADTPHGPDVGRPRFRVIAPGRRAPTSAADALGRSLAEIRIARRTADVEVVRRPTAAPPGLRVLPRSGDPTRGTWQHLGLEIDPIYRAEARGPLYPLVLASLRRQVAEALRQALFAYARRCNATAAPEHYQGLGPRALVRALHSADRRLQRLAGSYDFLLLVSPTNADEAWGEFRGRGFSQTPELRYRALPFDPDVMRRRLYAVRLEDIRDPTLQHLMREKREALAREVSMLAARGGRNFRYGSLQLFGGVGPDLLKLAERLLDVTKDAGSVAGGGQTADAREFRRRARAAIRGYRAESPRFAARVRRRNDIASGVMTSGGDLLVSDSLAVDARRVDALIHHEVGTHLVTYYNGVGQPIGLLRQGLAGYEPLQEGLAVLAEYLVGGLTLRRLQQLAARVVAVRSVIDGESFLETFGRLHEQHGLSGHRAFTTTLRVHRGGGLTKDAAYLRGLVDLLAYLSGGGEIEPLLVGKIALRHVPLVQELRRREVLGPPVVWPRYLRETEARQRLESCRGRSVLDLCAEAS